MSKRFQELNLLRGETLPPPLIFSNRRKVSQYEEKA